MIKVSVQPSLIVAHAQFADSIHIHIMKTSILRGGKRTSFFLLLINVTLSIAKQFIKK